MNSGLKSLALSSLSAAIALLPFIVPPPSHAQSALSASSSTIAQADAGIDLTYDASRVVTGSEAGGRVQGGGTRSVDAVAVCPIAEIPLTALVPFAATYPPGKSIPKTMNVWGATAQSHPTFWVYMPAIAPSIPVTFALETGNTTVYETQLPPPSQAGIVAIAIPKTAPALEPGKRYRWTLSFKCQAPTTAATPPATSNRTETIYVQATVLASTLDRAIANQLTPTPSRQNAALYARNGFWYDALTTLATLRQQSPGDATLQNDWKRLLNSMVLQEKPKEFDADKLAQQPFAP